MYSIAMDAHEVIDEIHFRRLLVAVDGSPSADLALAGAVTVARRDNAALTLICVAPDVIAESCRWPWVQALPDQDAADRSAETVLREAVDRIPEDIPVCRIMKRGRAGPVIVTEAGSSNYDAILLGGRGVGRIGSLLGSVSQYVMHHADVPVFVAHASTAPDADTD
jgi:nucleotide-binding universal stress UspA family protein